MPAQKYVKDARLNCNAIQSISRTLKALQKRSGYSQDKFARLIGVTPLTYRRLLAGKANPMILLLHSISCRLNIELEQLLGLRPLDTADLDGSHGTENTSDQVDQRSTGIVQISASSRGLSARRPAPHDRDGTSRTAQDTSVTTSATLTMPMVPGGASY